MSLYNETLGIATRRIVTTGDVAVSDLQTDPLRLMKHTPLPELWINGFGFNWRGEYHSHSDVVSLGFDGMTYESSYLGIPTGKAHSGSLKVKLNTGSIITITGPQRFLGRGLKEEGLNGLQKAFDIISLATISQRLLPMEQEFAENGSFSYGKSTFHKSGDVSRDGKMVMNINDAGVEITKEAWFVNIRKKRGFLGRLFSLTDYDFANVTVEWDSDCFLFMLDECVNITIPGSPPPKKPFPPPSRADYPLAEDKFQSTELVREGELDPNDADHSSAFEDQVLGEEWKKNPTLIEHVEKALNRANNAVKILEVHAGAYLSQTQYKLRYEQEHAKWFGIFERTVLSHLGFAEHNVAHEEQLEADPKLRELYNKLIADSKGTIVEESAETASAAEPDWVKDGPPSVPTLDSDPEITQSYKEIFEKQTKQHREFVNTTRERLRREPLLKKAFEDLMIQSGYKGLLQEYFIEHKQNPKLLESVSEFADEALNMVRYVEHPAQQTRALLKVAEGQAQIGDLSSSRATTAEALEATQDVVLYEMAFHTPLPIKPKPFQDHEMVSTSALGRIVGIKAKPFLFDEFLSRGYIERSDNRYWITNLGRSVEVGGSYKPRQDSKEVVGWPIVLGASLHPLKQAFLDRVDFRLFHMTHIDNLMSILEHGIFSHNTAPNYLDISNPDVNSRRERADPIHKKSLHEYVPLYFNPRNAMLYEKQAEYRSDIVVLEVARRVCLSNYTLFTERNAAANGCRFAYCLSDVKEFDWPKIQIRDWTTHGGVNVDIKQLMMSECLVYGHIDSVDLVAVHTMNTSMSSRLQSMLASVQHPSIHSSPGLFF